VSVRVVLAAGFALLLVALAVTLAQSAPRSAGSNLVPELQQVVELRGPDRRCQGGEVVPAETGALRLLIGTYGRPAPALRVVIRRPGGRTVTTGALPAGGPEGHVDVPLGEVDRMQPGLRVCLFVGGPGRTVLYGAADRLRFEYLRPAGESWIELLPTIAHRFALGRWNPLGSLLLPALALLLVAAWAGTARLVLREVGR
jgi:hypothetical protein